MYVTSIMYFMPHKDLIGTLKEIDQVEVVLWLAELNFFPLFQCQHQSYEHAIKKMHYYCYPEQNGPKAKQAFRTVQ
jgi:hypothetical protein